MCSIMFRVTGTEVLTADPFPADSHARHTAPHSGRSGWALLKTPTVGLNFFGGSTSYKTKETMLSAMARGRGTFAES